LTSSNGEAIKLIKGNGLSLNKLKVTDQQMSVNQTNLINGKYLLLQKGKKDYCLVKAG
jgi:tyrosyl-tRNA synthetase